MDFKSNALTTRPSQQTRYLNHYVNLMLWYPYFNSDISAHLLLSDVHDRLSVIHKQHTVLYKYTIPWCSGYHICLTRRRSWVRNPAESFFSNSIAKHILISQFFKICMIRKNGNGHNGRHIKTIDLDRIRTYSHLM